MSSKGLALFVLWLLAVLLLVCLAVRAWGYLIGWGRQWW